MKYIMFDIGEPAIYIPIIFPDLMIHSVVAERMGKMLEALHEFKRVRVRSAGTITMDRIDGVVCSGGSQTLKVQHHISDSSIIENYQYFHGVKI